MTVKINADTSDGLKLVSDTSGAIDFQSNGVNKMSMDSSGNLTANSFIGDGSSLTGVSGGKVLQVLQTIKTSTAIISGATAYTDVSGLSVNITPSSTSNKVLIIATYMIMGDTNTQGYVVINRDSTPLGRGVSNGNRVRANTQSYPNQTNEGKNSSFCYLDSPSSTSQITYKLRTRNQGTGNIYVNRSQGWTNSAQSSTNSSTITVMEIEG
jgi:hypothetical protein